MPQYIVGTGQVVLVLAVSWLNGLPNRWRAVAVLGVIAGDLSSLAYDNLAYVRILAVTKNIIICMKLYHS